MNKNIKEQQVIGWYELNFKKDTPPVPVIKTRFTVDGKFRVTCDNDRRIITPF